MQPVKKIKPPIKVAPYAQWHDRTSDGSASPIATLTGDHAAVAYTAQKTGEVFLRLGNSHSSFTIYRCEVTPMK